MPRIITGAQPIIKRILQSKDARKRCDLAISKWMIDASLLVNATTST